MAACIAVRVGNNMGPISTRTIVFLALAFGSGLGYILEPSVAWPEDYHFNAEEIDLMSGVVKPFEFWYSETHNRSRIDLFGGDTKRYYYSTVETDEHFEYGQMYMFHPETDENDDAVIKCEKMINYYRSDDLEAFLPDINEFTFKGTEEYGGKNVTVWIKEEEFVGKMRSEETLYVYQVNDADVPIQHIKKGFNLVTGSQSEHTIINYYNYNAEVDIESLEADKDKCKSYNPFDYEFNRATLQLHPTIPSDLDLAFHSYKKHHNKDYVDDEHEFRKQIFKKNWKHIIETNKKNLGYTLTVNAFADRTEQELKHLAATQYSGPIRGTHPFPHSLAEIEAMAGNNEIPEEFDLRSEGVISPVRNQASCGSCWAFAAAATVEGAVARSNGGRIMDLSEQSLVDCAWQYRSHGCQGTEAIDAVYQYIYKYGMPTLREYGPYLMADGVCKIKNMTNIYNIKGFVGVTPMSPNALKAAIYKYGPVTIGVLVTRNMVLYNGGVFYDFDSEPGAMNHAVTLVGYGVRNGDLYWIVKNSWGESWGEDGYILIAAKDNNCNVMTVPVYPLL